MYMTQTLMKRSTAATQPVGRTKFATLLLFGIVGYMFLDRTFAWLIHVPGVPIFLGEVLLALGVLELVRARQTLRFLVNRSATVKWILVFLVLGILRLAADMGTYGVIAFRDAAIFYYSALAIIVAAYVMTIPETIGRAIKAFTRIIPWYIAWVPIAILLSRTFSATAPLVPGSLTSILSFKSGNYAVWVSLAVAFLWLVQQANTPAEIRRRALLTAAGSVGIFVAGSQNRGGLVVGSAVIGLTVLLSKRPYQTLSRIGGIGIVLFGLLFVMDARIETGKREISVRQIVENVQSIFVDSGNDSLAGTKRWRLELWNGITQDVIYGDFPLGFGMGPNIAERYNAIPVQLDAFQTLRSAHNSHLSILARMGIPGATVWVLIWISLAIVALRVRRRLRHADPEALNLLTWLLLSVAAILGNAVFDPTLEGPQVAIPFYTFVGAALGMIARVDAGYPALKTASGGLPDQPLQATTVRNPTIASPPA